MMLSLISISIILGQPLLSLLLCILRGFPHLDVSVSWTYLVTDHEAHPVLLSITSICCSTFVSFMYLVTTL